MKHKQVDIKNFILISFLTLGMYNAYWGWSAWETVRRYNNETYKISSGLRAWVLFYSVFGLLPKLQTIAKKHGYHKLIGDPNGYALVYLLSYFALNLPISLYITIPAGALAGTLILVPFVKMYNTIVAETQAIYTPDKPNKALRNWLVVACVATYMAMIFVPLALPQ